MKKSLVWTNIHLHIFLCLYIIVLGIGLFHHEFWMDESHHWLLARDSASLSDLISNYEYDGHPIIWIFLLWIIGKFTSGIIYIKILNGLISTLNVIILLYKSPFRKIYRILFVFGYYPLFEYGVLSRSYALTVLFLLLFCVFYKQKGKLLLPFMLLGLAANSHLFGLIFCVILSGKILYDERALVTKNMSAIGALLFLMMMAFVTIKAPSDHYFYFDLDNFFNTRKFGAVSTMWWKALVPIPDMWQENFWNTNYFTVNYRGLSVLLVLFSWIAPLVFLRRQSRNYLVFYSFAIAIAVFCLLTGLHPTQRISGFLLFGLVIIFWLEKQSKLGGAYIVDLNSKTRSVLLYMFLSIQILSAGIFVVADVKRPFSNTKNISEFLDKHVDRNVPIYGGLFCNYIGLNNYSNMELYIAAQSYELNYCDWRVLNDSEHMKYMDRGVEIMQLNDYKEMIFLTHEEINLENILNYNVVLLNYFGNGMVKNENAYVYRISRKI